MSLKVALPRPISCASHGRRFQGHLPHDLLQPARRQEKSIQVRFPVVYAGNTTPRNTEVEKAENMKYFKAALESYVSEKIQEKALHVQDTKKLHEGVIKTTVKQMNSLLAKPSKISKKLQKSNAESSVVLLMGGLELWTRRVGGNQLSRTQYECAAQLLAAHALDYTKQNTPQLGAPKEAPKVSEREALVLALKPLLVDLLLVRKRPLDKKKRGTAGGELFDQMFQHLKLVWKYPEDIGQKEASMKLKTEAHNKVFLQLQRIVRDAGEGVKGIGKAKINREALYLTNVASSIAGML